MVRVDCPCSGRSLHHFNIVDHDEASLLVGFAVVVEIQAHTRVVGTGRRGESQHLLLPLVGDVRGVIRFVLACVLFKCVPPRNQSTVTTMLGAIFCPLYQ